MAWTYCIQAYKNSQIVRCTFFSQYFEKDKKPKSPNQSLIVASGWICTFHCDCTLKDELKRNHIRIFLLELASQTNIKIGNKSLNCVFWLIVITIRYDFPFRSPWKIIENLWGYSSHFSCDASANSYSIVISEAIDRLCGICSKLCMPPRQKKSCLLGG